MKRLFKKSQSDLGQISSLMEQPCLLYSRQMSGNADLLASTWYLQQNATSSNRRFSGRTGTLAVASTDLFCPVKTVSQFAVDVDGWALWHQPVRAAMKVFAGFATQTAWICSNEIQITTTYHYCLFVAGSAWSWYTSIDFYTWSSRALRSQRRLLP